MTEDEFRRLSLDEKLDCLFSFCRALERVTGNQGVMIQNLRRQLAQLSWERSGTSGETPQSTP
jgi:hypothetical protein